MLYEVQPLDIGTFLAVMALIVVVAFVATLLRRIARRERARWRRCGVTDTLVT
jgi:hypothetical protein